ncbi:hypothetical protein CHUAL_001611 [Chamberlinius hualienensis]
MGFGISILLIVLRFTFSLQQNASLYTVVSENQLRTNVPFRVHVSVYNGNEPVEINVSLMSNVDDTVLSDINSTIEEPPNGVLIELDVPKLPVNSSYFLLKVTGHGGVEFVHEQIITIQRARDFHIEVTVDKDIYHVGDIVKFNALIVDNRMQAVQDGELVNATIYNENNIIIKEWINKPTKRGFIWGEIRLNDKCHRGEHRIQVNYRGVPGVRAFYVPDKTFNQLFFDVNVEFPTEIKKEGRHTLVKGVLNANYKCGRQVYGTVDITIENDNSFPCILFFKCHRQFEILQNSPILGKQEFTVNLTELGNRVNFATIKATVKDQLTGRISSTTQRRSLNHYKKSNVKIGLNQYFFIPDMPLKFYIERKFDLPSNEEKTQPPTEILLTTWFVMNQNSDSASHIEEQQQNYTLIDDQRIYVNVTPPKSTERVIFQITSKNVVLQRQSVEKSPYNGPNNDIGIVVDDIIADIGSNITVDIYTSGNINLLSYDLIALRSRSIFESGNLVIDGKGPHRIKFPVTGESVRFFHLIVYGVTNDGRLVDDHRLFDTLEIHPFKINVKIEPENPAPGSEVNITLQSENNTFIFLKIADSAVSNKLQLLTNDVLLSSWDKEWHAAVELHNLILKKVPFFITSALGFFFNRQQLFENLSLRLLTNANQDVQADTTLGLQSRNPLGTESKNAIDIPRDDFPTLWLWRNYTIGEEGEVKFSAKLPDTITVWKTKVYGVDEKHGISVAEGPNILVTKSLFAFIDLPPRLVRGEAVLIRVIVFQNVTSSVNVTLISKSKRFQILDEDTHRVISITNITKEIQPREDGFAIAAKFLISPLYTGPIDVQANVASEEAEDTVIQRITVQDHPSKFQSIIYDAKDASRFGEEICTLPTIKVIMYYRNQSHANPSILIL